MPPLIFQQKKLTADGLHFDLTAYSAFSVIMPDVEKGIHRSDRAHIKGIEQALAML